MEAQPHQIMFSLLGLVFFVLIVKMGYENIKSSKKNMLLGMMGLEKNSIPTFNKKESFILAIYTASGLTCAALAFNPALEDINFIEMFSFFSIVFLGSFFMWAWPK